MSDLPTRLALQTGCLDDRRRHIAPDDGLWERAYRLFADRDHLDGTDQTDEMRYLCDRWPAREGQADVEAFAVIVALAAPTAGRDRILAAIAPQGLPPQSAYVPVLASPWATQRPAFPRIYDPGAERRAPIIAILDGPRSPRVAELLETLKAQDETLADAIVLGADLETLELLDRLSVDARRAAREQLAAHVEHDKRHWRRRADEARARQRLEGSHYGWHSDNLPPGCLEAARAENEHRVQAQLQRHAPPLLQIP